MDSNQNDIYYATLWGHIDELRRTLVNVVGIILTAMLLAFFFHESIIAFLTSPLKLQGKELLLFGPLDGILIALKTSFWVAITASSPIWLLVIMQFVAPALRREEKRLILPFILTSIIFIAIGMGFAFFLTIPFANSYLSSFNEGIGTNMWSLSNYLDYTLFLLLANGVAFELCVLGLFAIHLGIVTTDQLSAGRRYAILAAFILGALLTPPDVLTQLMLAVPLVILYEGAILYSRLYRS